MRHKQEKPPLLKDLLVVLAIPQHDGARRVADLHVHLKDG